MQDKRESNQEADEKKRDTLTVSLKMLKTVSLTNWAPVSLTNWAPVSLTNWKMVSPSPVPIK